MSSSPRGTPWPPRPETSKALDAALGELERVFTRHTAQHAFQNPGEVYAGRGLLYEDCLRQTEIDIGPELRAQFGRPLALVLQSARWFSHTIAARFDEALNHLYTELKARFSPHPVPASAMEVLFDPRNPLVPGIVQDVVKELTARWASILRFEPGARQLHLSTDELRTRMSSAFDAPCPGWPSARHHSADILIASDGPKPVEQGRCLCVLGEVHVNDTMLTRPLFLQLHPRPDEFAEAYKRDVEQARIFLVTSRLYRGHRKLWDPFFPGDFQLAWEDTAPWRPNGEVLRLADLIMENSADGLVVRTRDNALGFPASVYFERAALGGEFYELQALAADVSHASDHRRQPRHPSRSVAVPLPRSRIHPRKDGDRSLHRYAALGPQSRLAALGVCPCSAGIQAALRRSRKPRIGRGDGKAGAPGG